MCIILYACLYVIFKALSLYLVKIFFIFQVV